MSLWPYLLPLLAQWGVAIRHIQASYYRACKRCDGQREQVQVWELFDGSTLKVCRNRLGLWRLDLDVR